MRQRNVLCASDGSLQAKQALDIALDEFISPRDSVTVLSALNFYKTELPEEFQPKAIFDQHKKTLIDKVGFGRFKMKLEDVNLEGGRQVSDMVNAEKPDLIFLGGFGRKGHRSVSNFDNKYLTLCSCYIIILFIYLTYSHLLSSIRPFSFTPWLIPRNNPYRVGNTTVDIIRKSLSPSLVVV